MPEPVAVLLAALVAGSAFAATVAAIFHLRRASGPAAVAAVAALALALAFGLVWRTLG